MASPQPFVRPPLADATKQIRLLEVIRDESKLSYADQIHCRLTVHTLADVVGKFTAISYTWGPQAPQKEIIIDGCPVAVRMHCWYALWQMRFHHVARMFCEHDLYWMDAISIDQECHREKGQQISQMASIYSGAGLVAVCLGFSGKDCRLIPILGQTIARESFAVDYQKAVRHLSQRSYFQRVWTVQECSLAHRIVAFCGSAVMSWHTMSTMIGKSVELQVYFQSAAPHSHDSLARFPTKLLQNLNRKCFDPRDKLYGVLHLSQIISQLIQPDYGKDLSAVLLDYVHAYTSPSASYIPPYSLHLLMHSIRSLALTFSRDSPGFREQLQALLDEGSFDSTRSTWSLPSRSLPTFSRGLPLTRIYCPVVPMHILDDDEIISLDDYSLDGASVDDELLSPWHLPADLTGGRTSRAALYDQSLNAVCIDPAVSLSKAENGAFPRDQVFVASADLRHRDMVLSFGGSSFLAREQGDSGCFKVIAESVASRSDGMYPPADTIRKSEVRKSRWLCEFQVTSSELLALSLVTQTHSQLLRILCNDVLTVRGIKLFKNDFGRHWADDAARYLATPEDPEAPWMAQEKSSPPPRNTQSPQNPSGRRLCGQEISDCCGTVNPTRLALDGQIEGGRLHAPTCPWLQRVKPFAWKPEDDGEAELYKEDRDWVTKFPPS